jgi:L-histidine Nalpha-methyltransferase
VSKKKQLVCIPGAGLEVVFRRGETIWTESSHKFKLDDLSGMARIVGFEALESWVDSEWPFAENLWVAAPAQ